MIPINGSNSFECQKKKIIDICKHVKPLLSKHDTKYGKLILVEIKVSCAIYKLAQGGNILVCHELFTIGRSITALVL
jgi:hypothetical protein